MLLAFARDRPNSLDKNFPYFMEKNPTSTEKILTRHLAEEKIIA